MAKTSVISLNISDADSRLFPLQKFTPVGHELLPNARHHLSMLRNQPLGQQKQGTAAGVLHWTTPVGSQILQSCRMALSSFVL